MVGQVTVDEEVEHVNEVLLEGESAVSTDACGTAIQY